MAIVRAGVPLGVGCSVLTGAWVPGCCERRRGFAGYAQGGHHVEVRRTLTTDQRARYSRHLLMPEVGEEGQLKLLDSKVLCVGAGGLEAQRFIGGRGVGTLGIIDADTVDKSGCSGFFTPNRVGEPKVDSAATPKR